MPWLPYGVPQWQAPESRHNPTAHEIRCPKCGERQDMPDDLKNAPWCLDELLESVTQAVS